MSLSFSLFQKDKIHMYSRTFTTDTNTLLCIIFSKNGSIFKAIIIAHSASPYLLLIYALIQPVFDCHSKLLK